jgi:hypothetical protein
MVHFLSLVSCRFKDDSPKNPKMFVTAASSNHFKSLLQFLASLGGRPVIVYDIGLTAEEAATVKAMRITYRLFNWSSVPSWGLLTPETAGYYVWKPVIVDEVMKEAHDVVIWCDAGNVVTDAGSLHRVTKAAHIYTPYSTGALSRWTHTQCLDGLKMTEVERSKPMRNGALIGLDAKDPVARRFVEEWRASSLVEAFIVGDRSNHRHDQSILSCLFYKYRRSSPAHCIGVEIHRDCD